MKFSIPMIMLGAGLSLAGCGGGGGPTSTPAVATAALSAAQTTVDSGASTTLTWSSTNATSCTASGGWTGTVATGGTHSTGALTATTTYTLVCSGAGGASSAESVTVTVTPPPTTPVPTATLTASPTTVASGAASTLTWSSTNATACTASGGWIGTLAASGTKSTGALTANASYSLTCSGTGGTSAAATASVTVTAPVVTPKPSVTLTATPTIVVGGGASTLAWSSANATACTASGSWTNAAPGLSGNQTSGPVTMNSSFSITCTGPGGSAAATATVNVVPTATLTASPTAVLSGATSTLTWSSSNATACAATVGWTGTLGASGTQVTSALTAAATYSLTCSGAGGTSAVATTTVTVASGTLTMSPKSAQLTVSQTQQFAVTVPGGATAIWSVDNVAYGNASVGTVSSSGLYTAGTTPGTHTVLAADSGDAMQSASAAVAVTDLAGVYTYHNDLSRDGSNTQEYALTTANVNTASFGKLASCPVDGAVYAQPLWVANLMVGGAQHNVVYVATQHDSVYAFDADAAACTLLWHVTLLDVAHGVQTAEVPVLSSQVGLGTGDISPEIGITGTPVIDPSTNTLYVVAKSATTATPTVFNQRIHALNILTGAEQSGAPTVIMGTYPGTGDGGTAVTFNSRQELQRTGLALVNGTVYVAFTSHEDASPWYGWMMSYKFVTGTLALINTLNVAPNQQKAGIWMSGGAPSADSNGNLYALTGNGDFDVTSTTAPNNDYGDSLVQLSPSLQISQYFRSVAQPADDGNDMDFGAGGATVLADLPAGNTVTHVVMGGGKDGNLYVLNRDNLGSNSGSHIQSINIGTGLYATGAVWNNNYYVAGINGPMLDYQLNTSTAMFTAAANAQSAHTFYRPGATPSVSSNAALNGIVWGLDIKNYCTHSSGGCGPVVLWAFDATNLSSQIYNSGSVAADAAGYAVKFTVPTVANGRVYVGTRGNNTGGAQSSTSTPGELDIYGLKP